MSLVPRILMVVTSHATMGETGKATGLWLEELAVPYQRFVEAGADVTVASIHGGKVPVDPRSTPPTGPEARVVERFLANPTAARTLVHSLPLEALDATRFDAVFLAATPQYTFHAIHRNAEIVNGVDRIRAR